MFHFIHDIIRLFKPKRQPDEPKANDFTDFTTQTVDEPVEAPTDNIEETPSPSPSPKPRAKMTIYYVDEDGHYLHEFNVIHGFVGDPVSFIIPDFDHYVLFKIMGVSTYMQKEDNEVTLQYNRLNGKPVNIFFINYDTYSMICLPQMAIGKYNNEFQINIPELSGFKLINYSGDSNGIFDDYMKHLIIYYRRNDWHSVQKDTFYIRLREYTRVYNDTNGDVLHVLLPKKSIWKVFYQVTTDDALWLNIGPNQWIVDRNFFRMQYPFAKELTNTDSWKIKQVHYPATIENDNHQSVAVYNFPYGSCIGFLHNGNSFIVTQEIVDQNDVQWVEINNLHYIVSDDVKKELR
ncbi:MucBP domain-containing protein [Apilactobacillus kunkeei]|uniref:MucBP domain-containing protein n=1 Tax=Apilactobacillus kunkeei TaxID=148814 RepID=UPI0030EA9031